MHMGKIPERSQDPQQQEPPRRHDQRPRIDDEQRHRQPRQAHQARQRTGHGPRHQAQQITPPTLDSSSAQDRHADPAHRHHLHSARPS